MSVLNVILIGRYSVSPLFHVNTGRNLQLQPDQHQELTVHEAVRETAVFAGTDVPVAGGGIVGA